MIEVRGIVKRYGEPPNVFTVLDELDVDFHAGKLNYLVGPSGCGKTTLISIIGAMLKADAGTIRVFGQEITALNEQEMAAFRARNVGFTFQQFNLIRTLTVQDNVAAALIPENVSWKVARAAADEQLERFGLLPRAMELPGRLSGGEQQRVALARALVKHPKILICDEPTAALDRVTGRSVMENIRKLANDPEMVVLTVTHDTRIFDLADSIATMEDGKIKEVKNNAEA
jgi:putative ABC transport system ATP-binding protein